MRYEERKIGGFIAAWPNYRLVDDVYDPSVLFEVGELTNIYGFFGTI